MVRCIRFVIWSAIGSLLLGCSHYRLGTASDRDFESVFIAPVQSDSLVPQATALLSTQIREAFIRDGRLRVTNTPEEADAVLSVQLRSYRRDGEAALPTDSGLSRVFSLNMTAEATLASPDSGKVWFSKRRLNVDRRAFTDDGTGSTSTSFLQPVQQTQSEFATLPLIGENLARQLTHTVLETW